MKFGCGAKIIKSNPTGFFKNQCKPNCLSLCICKDASILRILSERSFEALLNAEITCAYKVVNRYHLDRGFQ